MIFGLTLATFTAVHVALSLVGLIAGIAMLVQLIAGQRLGAWNGPFLAATILTSVTGFFFPGPFGPAHVIGIISLVVLAVAMFALSVMKRGRIWCIVYAAAASTAIYLNAFAAVVQSFQKVPRLAALAPTQSEAPFVVAQGVLLVLFVVAGTLAARSSFRRA